MSVVLLVSAGLFLRSVMKVRAVNLGVDADRVATVAVTVPPAHSSSMEEYAAAERDFARRLVVAVRRAPGIERASVGIAIPLVSSTRLTCFGSNMTCGNGVAVGLWVPGLDSIPALPGGGPYITAVADDYFDTMGTRILNGRGFRASDRTGTAPVVVVSAAMARKLWPGRSALNECMHIGAAAAPCARVIGIAADVHRSGFHEEPSLQYYVPLGQERGFTGTWLVVRPSRGGTSSWGVIRKALLAAEPSITGIDMHVLSESLDDELRPLRLGMVSFALGGVLSLLVAALGLYSVMAYMVSSRTHEIGVRMALGATRWTIASMVVLRGAPLASMGIVIGLVISRAARSWLQLQLFETSATDPLVLGGAAIVLQSVALVACWLPARRAARVSPVEALKTD
jgi:predicted permease